MANLSIHPLFLVFGAYCALTGELFDFIIYTLTAVIHEMGHSFAAARRGYKLNRLSLMPYGAVISGDLEGLKLRDEIVIAASGPLTSLACYFLFAALWWLLPETYAYTALAASASLSIFLVNLLPIYPLDGGRILCALLTLKFKRKSARSFSILLASVFFVVLIILFIASIREKLNLSLLFFAVFMLVGAFSRDERNIYVRLYSALNKKNLARGMAIKRVAVDENIKIMRLMEILDPEAVNEVEVYSSGKSRKILLQADLEKLLISASVYDTLKDYA